MRCLQLLYTVSTFNFVQVLQPGLHIRCFQWLRTVYCTMIIEVTLRKSQNFSVQCVYWSTLYIEMDEVLAHYACTFSHHCLNKITAPLAL